MAVDFAVIDAPQLRRTVVNIAQAECLSVGFFDLSLTSIGRLTHELKKNSVLLLNVVGGEYNGLTLLNRLRLDGGFRGTAIILSFVSRQSLSKLQGHEVLDTEGCFYVQLPLMVDELAQLIACRLPLSNDLAVGVRKRLGAFRIAQEARVLKHDFGNKLGLALAHFRTIEKLSYFNSPCLDSVLKEARYIRTCLTSQKIREIRRSVDDLLSRAMEFGVYQSQVGPSLDQCWDTLDEWFTLMALSESERNPTMDEIFAGSRRAQKSLKEILEVVKNLQEVAQRAKNHVQ